MGDLFLVALKIDNYQKILLESRSLGFSLRYCSIEKLLLESFLKILSGLIEVFFHSDHTACIDCFESFFLSMGISVRSNSYGYSDFSR